MLRITDVRIRDCIGQIVGQGGQLTTPLDFEVTTIYLYWLGRSLYFAFIFTYFSFPRFFLLLRNMHNILLEAAVYVVLKV